MAEKRNLREQIFGAEENAAASLDPEKLGRFQRIAGRMYHTPQLSAKEVGIPAIAKAGRKISEMINDTYRMYFFINVLRLDPFYITVIISLMSVYNALIRPLMGIAYDRTRTRWGKARPFTLFGPALYFGSTALLFCGRLFFDNDIPDDPRKILFVFAMMFLRDTFSLLYKIPTDNYLILMTPNPKDRMSAGLWQTYAEKWSGDFLLAGLIMPLLTLARGGIIKVSPGVIFAGFGIFSAVVGTSGGLLMSMYCRERIILPPKPAPTTKTLFYILKNKYALRKFAAEIASEWWSKGSLPWDVIMQMEIFGGSFRGAPFYLPRQVMQFVSLALVEPFKRMFGGSYRKTVIFMRTWDFVFGMSRALIGLFSPKVIGTWWKAGLVFAVFDALVVSNDAPSTVMENEIDREIDDYTEYVTGEKPDGTIGVLTQLALKLTEPLKALWNIVLLKWVSYDANIADNKLWSQDRVREYSTMYSRVFFLETMADIVKHVLKTIPYFFYDLEGKKKEDMYAALNERRALIAKEGTMAEEMATMMEMMAEEEFAKQA